MATKSTRYSPEVRARAVRLVFEHRAEHASEWSAISSIASKIGCKAETLRLWVRQAQRDQGLRDGMTTDERARLKALEREVRELRQANEILPKASAYFAQPPPAGGRLHHRRCRGQETSAGRRSTAGSSHDRVHPRASGTSIA